MRKIQVVAIAVMLAILAACGGAGAPPPWEVSEHTTVTNKDGSQYTVPSEKTNLEPAQPISSSTLMVVDTISFREDQVFRYVIDNDRERSVTTRMSITQDNIRLVFEDELSYFMQLNRVTNWDSQVFPDVRVVSCNMKNDAGKLLRVIVKVNQNTGSVLSVQIGGRLMSNTSLGIKTSSNEGWHVVKTGENLQLIARKYQLTVEEILDLNPMVSQRRGYMVMPGEPIKIAR